MVPDVPVVVSEWREGVMVKFLLPEYYNEVRLPLLVF